MSSGEGGDGMERETTREGVLAITMGVGAVHAWLVMQAGWPGVEVTFDLAAVN